MGSCVWPSDDAQMIAYHDTEWGVPLHDDRKLFEFILLDAFQAGLSWRTILHRRDGFRKAFADFDPARIARFTPARIEKVLLDPGIIRNRQKVESTVSNARAFLKVQDEHGSFDSYIWQFVDGVPKRNAWKTSAKIPSTSPASDVMSKELKSRGFKFVGSTICYAFMQAAGLVNDHLVSCFRYGEVQEEVAI